MFTICAGPPSDVVSMRSFGSTHMHLVTANSVSPLVGVGGNSVEVSVEPLVDLSVCGNVSSW